MDSDLSENLTSLRNEFSVGNSETKPTEPVEVNVSLPPVSEAPSEVSIDDVPPAPPVPQTFPIETQPQVAPLYVPAVEPVAGVLAAETAFNVKSMKLSEFINWLSDDKKAADTMIKTLAAEMSIAGFESPSSEDLTLAAGMWAKKNYQSQNAQETRKFIIKNSSPVELRAEMEVFSNFNSNSNTILLSETKESMIKPFAIFGALLAGGTYISYLVTRK